MTQNDLPLVADAYVRTALGSGHTIEQLIEYFEQTRGDPELVLAIKRARQKYDRKLRN
jgi:hypothetical protein